MKPPATDEISRETRTGLKATLYFAAKYCWYKFGLRSFYFRYLQRFNSQYWHLKRFYRNILSFRNYLEYGKTARVKVDSPSDRINAAAVPPNSPGWVFVDCGKIKPISGVSIRHYEPGAFRTRDRVSKAKIGVSTEPAAWRHSVAPNDADAGRTTDHPGCCLAVSRRTTESFALQLFHVFICFLHLRSLQRQGYEVESLLLDSDRGKLSELYTKCLPDCRFPEDLKDVHRFRHLVFAEREQCWDGNWRQVLYTCGLSDDFHRFVLSAFDIAPPEPTRRVGRMTLIRRKKHIEGGGKPCIDRVIKNEEEVIAALARRYPDIDVQAVYFEELPLREQLKLFTESDVLVSMHGAGLIAGAYFVPPNAAILELFPKYYRIPESVLTCRAIAADRGLHYSRWLNHRRANEFGSDVQPGVPSLDRYHRTPIRHASLTRVPVAALTRRIDRLVKKIELRR